MRGLWVTVFLVACASGSGSGFDPGIEEEPSTRDAMAAAARRSVATRAPGKPAPAPGDVVLDDGVLRIATSARFAGALSSIVYDGKELVNTWDHGRELGVAWSTDDWGECANPTEAGSADDAQKPTTSSVLLAVRTPDALTLETDVRPAFWLAPGADAPNGCGEHGERVAHNATVVADDVLTKRVRLGAAGDPHLVETTTSITLAAPASSIALEAPTGYLSSELSSLHRVDPTSAAIAEIDVDAATLSTDGVFAGAPVMASTPDGAFAVGAWSPDAPTYYAVYRWDTGDPASSTTKWSVVVRRTPVASPITITSYVAVGTRDEVVAALAAARRAHAGVVDAGIFAGDVFDWSYYLATQPDLGPAGIATEVDARAHWLAFGVREGRRASASFDVGAYLDLNADVRAATNGDHERAILHWLEHGKSEGRRATR